MEIALKWVSKEWERQRNLEHYMSEHRYDKDINEYFIQSYYKEDFHNFEVSQWKPLIEGGLWKSVPKEP